jgi:hypothetical protein
MITNVKNWLKDIYEMSFLHVFYINLNNNFFEEVFGQNSKYFPTKIYLMKMISRKLGNILKKIS